MKQKAYLAIDLKSFYASVECVARGLDPLTTNLVVADQSRTEKTICLAVSPSLKSYGISGRARLFEVVERVKQVNIERARKAPEHKLQSGEYDNTKIQQNPSLQLDYIVATPRMAEYERVSSKVYSVYLKYVAPEDIHVYSIDEVFIDATSYLATYHMTPRQLAMTMIHDVLKTTGITATAGIGTNLYLAKIAMDIEAKHCAPDKDGVRIAELDELTYRKKLWTHTPLTDFWRVGKGYEKKLLENGLFCMGDIARCSLGKPNEYYNEELLYKLFGINAELLIDHAWGYEPTTIADIKAYKPETNSLSSGQVLQRPYSNQEARVIVQEMAEVLALDLVKKHLVTDQIVLTVGYDTENVQDASKAVFVKETATDYYGRKAPKHAHGTSNLGRQTASSKLIVAAALEIFNRTVNPKLTVRRVNITANHVIDERQASNQEENVQLDLFGNYEEIAKEQKKLEDNLRKEKQLQKAILRMQDKYGKNTVLKGLNFEEGATTVERNNQIGGHKA